MTRKTVFAGHEDFREVREKGLYYVDKTAVIKELAENRGTKVFVITRPRLFGKTMTLTMLREFLDCAVKNSSALFAGLAVLQDKELCKAWMNQHPVLFLSLKELQGETFVQSCYSCVELFAAVCMKYGYLLTSPKVASPLRKRLQALCSRTAKDVDILFALQTLCLALRQHWGKKVVILVDDCDAPLAHVRQGEDYDRLASFLAGVFEAAFKNNSSLEFALMTGCQQTVFGGVSSGSSNARCYGIDEPRFADKIGFTPEEVRQLLADAQLPHKEDDVRTLYGGCCFGIDQEMYCPGDVVKYAASQQENYAAQPGSPERC